MAHAGIKPLTPAAEFSERLADAAKTLRGLAASGSDEQFARRFAKAQAVDTADDLWHNFSMAGGWAPGKTLADAYQRLENALKENEAKTHGGEREGYSLVLSYLNEVGY